MYLNTAKLLSEKAGKIHNGSDKSKAPVLYCFKKVDFLKKEHPVISGSLIVTCVLSVPFTLSCSWKKQIPIDCAYRQSPAWKLGIINELINQLFYVGDLKNNNKQTTKQGTHLYNAWLSNFSYCWKLLNKVSGSLILLLLISLIYTFFFSSQVPHLRPPPGSAFLHWLR